MDLLEKFNAVEVKAAQRISEADRDFCERHQAAYESAITSYEELLRVYKQLEKSQNDLLGSEGKKNSYLLPERDVSISEYAVKQHLKSLKESFLKSIVNHFCDTYAISLSCWAMQRSLEGESKDDAEETNDGDTMPKPTVRYEAIVEQVFKEMDGRSFEEYAMYQLKSDVRKAVGTAGICYERKKAVIFFRDSFCYASTRYQYSYNERVEWELTDKAKSIQRALAHFETGKFADYPGPLGSLVTDGKLSTDLLGYYDCEKLEEMKLYKNGRMDIRFASPALAAEFEEIYLKA